MKHTIGLPLGRREGRRGTLTVKAGVKAFMKKQEARKVRRTTVEIESGISPDFTLPENYRVAVHDGKPVAAVAIDNQPAEGKPNPAYIDLLDGIALVMVGVPFHKGIARVERFLRSNGEARSILKSAINLIPAGEIRNAIERA